MISRESLKNAETQFLTFASPPDAMALESGESIGPVTLAYETYGRLNADNSNGILILHALSGDSHAAGYYQNEEKPGWWDDMIGPGKAFDTNRYFIICSNVLGGCRGSTGPSSENPVTGRPYALQFPLITIRDMIDCQRRLIEHLGIRTLLCAAGGSMGGMQALAWLAYHPGCIKSVIPIATTMKHSPQQIAFNEVGRQAIMADSHWRWSSGKPAGDYYSSLPPDKGLALARMIGHITYMSETSMAEKFGRQKKTCTPPFKFTADFEVEGYLRYRGDNFVKRFDANSYLYITKAMDNFDVSEMLAGALAGHDVKALILAFKSDWLYPAYQSKEIVKVFKKAGRDATYCEIESTYGHDAFLLEVEEETHLISHFLKRVSHENGIYSSRS